MPRLRQFGVLLLGSFLLGGCHRAPPPAAAPRDFALADAMQHWYGRYDASTQTARANLPEHPALDLTSSAFAPKDPVDITPIFDAAYTQAGHQRHVIVTAAVPHRSDKPGRPGDDSFHCLMCRPVIGMAVFTLRLNAWLLESENPAVDLAGGEGRAPAVRLMPLGADVHGIRLESHIDASDTTTTSMSLLVPWHADVLRAFTAETASSNRNACGPASPLRDPCYAWQRADAFAPVPGQQYDDLTLTASGTRPAPDAPAQPAAKPSRRGKNQPVAAAPQALPAIGVDRWRFREGRYFPLSDDEGGSSQPR